MGAMLPHSQLICILVVISTIASIQMVSASDRPIIGVLTVGPTGNECGTFMDHQNSSTSANNGCFTVYYVKWIEAAGGRVVPIPYNAPVATLDRLFNSVNGILFTGGGLQLWKNTTYYQTAAYLYNRVLAANAKGDHMPLWGTCMGFQLLNIITADDETVLQTNVFDSESISYPLELTPSATTSRLLGSAPADVVKILKDEPVTSNLHHDGVTPDDFAARPKLTSFFNLISINHDRKGKAFISTMEAKNMPIYGVQWHPERPQFEWGVTDMGINHGPLAVRAMQYFAQFFINEARHNAHSFGSGAEEQAALIYNYHPHSVGPQKQAYFF